MRVLVVGNGGREHAICWKINQSPLVEKLFCIPGNAGIQEIAECIEFTVDDIQAITSFAKNKAIDLTIIGPEVPLVLGLADSLKKEGLTASISVGLFHLIEQMAIHERAFFQRPRHRNSYLLPRRFTINLDEVFLGERVLYPLVGLPQGVTG